MNYNKVNVNISGPKQPTSTYKTKVLKGNHSFASQVTEPNMKYVIKHNFDLGGATVTIPEDCLLEFDGGSLNNGKCISNNTEIIGDYQKSYDCLYGVFKNSNVEVNYNKTGISKQINTYFKHCEPRKNNFASQGIAMTDDYYIVTAADSSNNCEILLFDKYFNYIGLTHINQNTHGNDLTIVDGDLFIANSISARGISKVSISDVVDAVNNGTDIDIIDLNIESGVQISCIDYDAQTEQLAVYLYDTNQIHIYSKTLELIRSIATHYYDNIIIERDVDRVLKPSIIFRNGIVYHFVGTSKYGTSQKTPFIIVAVDATSGNYFIYNTTFALVGNYEQEGVIKDVNSNNALYSVSNGVIGGTSCIIISKLVFDDIDVSSITTIDSDITDDSVDLEYLYVSPSQGNYISDGSRDKPYKNIESALINITGRTKTVRLLAGTYNLNASAFVNANLRIEGYGTNVDYDDVIVNLASALRLQRSSDVYLANLTINGNVNVTQMSTIRLSSVAVNGEISIIESFAFLDTIYIDYATNAFTIESAVIYRWRHINLGTNVTNIFKLQSSYSSIITNHILSGIDNSGFVGKKFIQGNSGFSLEAIQEVTSADQFNTFYNYIVSTSDSFPYSGITFIITSDIHPDVAYLKKGIYRILKGKIYDSQGNDVNCKKFGSTSTRPIGIHTEGAVSVGQLNGYNDTGFRFFDRTLTKPIYVKSIENNGIVNWIESDGAAAGVARSGATANRPVGSAIYVGFQYQDTTLGKPVYANAISGDTVTWVDATGATV